MYLMVSGGSEVSLAIGDPMETLDNSLIMRDNSPAIAGVGMIHRWQAARIR